MTEKLLKGRALGGGTIEGEAIVSQMAFNWAGAWNPLTGEIIDPRHDCTGMNLKDKIFVYSYSRGSTTNPSLLMEGVRNKVNPIALVMLDMEPMTMMGVASAAVFYNANVPSVDHTDQNPLEVIKTGDKIRVNGDTGTVEILS